MARKSSGGKEGHRGFHDVAGILLLGFSALLLVALFSYDPHDLSQNIQPANRQVQNWIGPFGARMADLFLKAFGAASFVLPVLTCFLGLGCFFEAFAYLRRRWAWLVTFMICSVGLLHLHGGLVLRNRGTLSRMPGGILGENLNGWVLHYFGKPGATILLLTLYFITLLFLTNFQLGQWVRMAFAPKPREATADPFESELGKKAAALRKREAELRREVEEAAQEERAAVGVDGLPVPEPKVTDLSISQGRSRRTRKSTATETDEPEIEAPGEAISEGEQVEIIPGEEVMAATTEGIVGSNRLSKTSAIAREDSPRPAIASETADEDAEAAKPEPTEPTPQPVPPPKVKAPRKRKPVAVASVPMIGDYKLPPMDLLNHPDPNLRPSETKEELMAKARLMQRTLAEFGIEVEPGDITKGPTITRYELHPVPGVKLERIQALSNNLAAALKAERIHILAPVPGKSSVGIEVPNPVKTKVIVRDLIESEDWRNTKGRLPIVLGKDVYGKPIIADLVEMPHLLIAGSTGAGKSVCINLIISSLLYRFSPDQLRFVMIDPKVVELQHYNALPHLVVPVVTDPKKVILALRWVVSEMEKRYQIFARVGVRNINSFNSRPKNKPLPEREQELPLTARKEKVEAGADGFAVEVDEEIVVPRDDDIVIPEKLSYIVVIIDELADLMLVAPADVEMAIARITQMARAAGIHCIVATQRPSVDVITGVIKANIPARIAFQVASRVDSRTILDAMGADKLLGKGDMLYLPPGSAKLHRAQGALITDEELQRIVDFIARQGKPSYEMEIHQALQKAQGSVGQSFDPDESACNEDEELIQQCIEVIRSEQKASVSLMQRRLRLGYTRAARIMDELENRGIVGPSKGAEPRDILIDLDGEGADGAGQQAV